MKRGIICLIGIFTFLLLYLHQKISLYIEAYRLAKNYKIYNELVAKRDALMYNFYSKTSLEKLNQWAEIHQFIIPEEEKVLAYRIKKAESAYSKAGWMTVLAQVNRRIFNLPLRSQTFAEEK